MKSNAKKNFLKLINNTISGKTMENVRKHKNIKHVITEKEKLFGITTKLSCNNFLSKNVLAIDLRK